MIQAATLLGGSLETDDEGFRTTFNDAFPPLHLNSGMDNVWRANIAKAIVHAIIGQLSDRLVNPNEEEADAIAKRKQRSRKDLYGIGTAIDTFATKGLISSTAAPFLKKPSDIFKEAGVNIDLKNIKEDPIQHQRVHSIIAGSIRAYDRLHKAEIAADGKCPHCGD